MSDLNLDWQQMPAFWVPGEPKGQPRPRARAMKTWSAKKRRMVWIAQVYNPDDAAEWKTAVRVFAFKHRPAEPLEGPLRVDIVIYMPRPKYMMERKYPDGPVLFTAKPDRDNLDKPILDAMTEAAWWRDDAQVCAGEVIKVYHSKQGRPGAVVTVSVLPQPQASLFERAGAAAARGGVA